jgi:peptidoglycan glycosyltransferase
MAAGCLFWSFYETPEQIARRHFEKIQEFRALLLQKLGPSLLKNNFAKEIDIADPGDDPELLSLEYTLDSSLQTSAEKLLKSYKPDYGAVVMMDAETGRILTLASFEKNNEDGTNMALRGTFPAASIFKIITATAAIDKYEVTANTKVMFNGGNHTLYKRNVMSDATNRWTRGMTLREAFARSVNTVFGRLTLERLAPQDLEEYANRYGFNRDIRSDIPFAGGFTDIPKEKNYHLTELASGFNKVTRMSPLHGAMIAGAIAEDGVMRVPYIVERARNSSGEVVYQAEPVTSSVTMSQKGALQLQELMEATITEGTSRKSFKPLTKNKKFKQLVVGGKTGSLTGDNPKGKVDWFVGYAMNDRHRIAIAALTVNVRYWTVKSSYLAQSLFQAKFKKQFTEDNQKFFNEAQRDLAADGPTATDSVPSGIVPPAPPEATSVTQ